VSSKKEKGTERRPERVSGHSPQPKTKKSSAGIAGSECGKKKGGPQTVLGTKKMEKGTKGGRLRPVSKRATENPGVGEEVGKSLIENHHVRRNQKGG